MSSGEIVVRDDVWAGADPGGANRFGVALLRANGELQAACVSHASEAAEWVAHQGVTTLAGAGVDAPLWWSSGRSSDRVADQWLRRTYGLASGTVQTVNSLRGAALAQGMMFVQRVRERFGNLPVTEAHPKALTKALKLETWSAVCSRFGLRCELEDLHQQDAVLAAIAAREGFGGRWNHDLSQQRSEDEQDPHGHWLAPVHYFWPE